MPNHVSIRETILCLSKDGRLPVRVGDKKLQPRCVDVVYVDVVSQKCRDVQLNLPCLQLF